jgi:hypothetical protein
MTWTILIIAMLVLLLIVIIVISLRYISRRKQTKANGAQSRTSTVNGTRPIRQSASSSVLGTPDAPATTTKSSPPSDTREKLLDKTTNTANETS